MMNAKKKKILIVLWTLAIILAFIAVYVTFVDRGYGEICFVDVGQGDSCLVKTEKGKALLIDGGDKGSGNYVLAGFLRTKYISRLDGVFISHLHSDHTQGIYELIDNNFPISKIYVSHTARNEEDFVFLENRILRNKIELVEVKNDDVIPFDEMRVTIVSTGLEEGFDESPNNNSVVMRLDYGENSILFTGDATTRVENQLLDDNIDTDILKVGHHGSSSSTGREFLEKVSPVLSIISVGEDNKYNHPSKRVLNALNEEETSVMRTDYSGTITLIMTEDDLKAIQVTRKP